jgi:hypothetical protein
MLNNLRRFLSFKTVVTSRNIIVFKIKLSWPKIGHPSRARSLVPRATSCPTIEEAFPLTAHVFLRLDRMTSFPLDPSRK